MMNKDEINESYSFGGDEDDCQDCGDSIDVTELMSCPYCEADLCSECYDEHVASCVPNDFEDE